MMSRKEIKCRRLGWTLFDENIENVERVNLVPEVQRELGCSVGEYVFLEYPWAFVPREAVSRLAKTPGSALEPHREIIEAYTGDTFLVGYSSVELIALDFVICLTENARWSIVKRNADISRRIREKVARKIIKTGGPWSSLGSETDLDDGLLRSTRDRLEVEVCFPVDSLGSSRELSDRTSKDSWDSYVELLPYENFENIERKCVSKMIQTHLELCDLEMQTYPGNPRNAWTQYMYVDTTGGLLLEDDDQSGTEEEEKEPTEEKSEKEPEERKETGSSKEVSELVDEQSGLAEKGPLELFLEARAPEMIDAVRYNTVVNLHVDDIETLAQREFEITCRPRDEITNYVERFALVDLHFAAGKVISDASWHPSLLDCVVVAYVTASSSDCNVTRNSSCTSANGALSRAEPTVLLWSLGDSLRPRISLRCHREIYRVSFCPTNGDFIIGGAASGQVVVWNIHDQLRDWEDVDRGDAVIKLEPQIRRDVSVALDASVASDQDLSHELPIRCIQWLPSNCRVEPSGKLTKLNTNSCCQFVTIAEDGIVAIWDLLRYSITSQLKPSDFKSDLDDVLRPVYRLDARPFTDSLFTPLYLCLPSDSVFQEDDKRQRDHGELDAADVDYTRRLWIGTAQGDLVCCTWEGQVFDVETSGLEECKLFSRSSAHDGPVTAILRSPHLHDVLLTIGGRVFAVWKDDYLESPLFRRKSDCLYTACCWSNRPGIFLMVTNLGDLEVWDIRRRSTEPVLTQIISRQPITLLSLRESYEDGLKLIGAGDFNSAFRIFEEPTELEEDTIERLDWFEEYVWREVRRKRMFSSWQEDFLRNDAQATSRRQARTDEERKMKLETARLQLHRQHEERLRLEAEEKLRKIPKSKDTIWKMRQQGRMKKVLLKKKRFVPRELEEKRLPLVCLAEERSIKMIKARNEAALRDTYFDNFVSLEFPEYYNLEEKDKSSKEQRETINTGEIIDIYLKEFHKIKDEARKIVEEQPYAPKFNRSICVKKGKEMM